MESRQSSNRDLHSAVSGFSSASIKIMRRFFFFFFFFLPFGATKAHHLPVSHPIPVTPPLYRSSFTTSMNRPWGLPVFLLPDLLSFFCTSFSICLQTAHPEIRNVKISSHVHPGHSQWKLFFLFVPPSSHHTSTDLHSSSLQNKPTPLQVPAWSHLSATELM